MISKVLLQSIIEKYYLDGLVESVKWIIKDEKLSIKFINTTKDTTGEITFNKFPLKSSKLAIYNTSQLLKLNKATQGLIYLTTDGSKLYIADEAFNISYSLAEEFLVPKPPKVTLPEECAAQIEINIDIISNLVKAKKSIDNSNNLIIKKYESPLAETPQIEFLFGENNNDSNKISYPIEGKINKNFPKLLFNSDIFKSILENNKDLSAGIINIYEEGLMSIAFTTPTEVNSKYYLVALENN